jgi:2-methylcitrate dehydratase
VALKYGTVEPRHFGAEYWRDPRLLALVQKVTVSVSEEANRRAPEAMLSIVEVVTSAKKRFTAVVPYHRGHFKNPMTDQEVEAKFRTLAPSVLTPEHTDTLLKQLWNVEQVKDVAQLIRMFKRSVG